MVDKTLRGNKNLKINPPPAEPEFPPPDLWEIIP